jgi:hypothetical protein
MRVPSKLPAAIGLCLWGVTVACSLQMPKESEVFASDGGRVGDAFGVSGKSSETGGRAGSGGTSGASTLGGRDVSEGGGVAGEAGVDGDGGRTSNGGGAGRSSAAGGVSSGGVSANGGVSSGGRFALGGGTGKGGAGGLDADDGLAAHFTFDEISGEVAENLKDTTKSGTYIGSCDHPKGQVGGAVRIRNLNSDVIGTSDWIELPAGLLSDFTTTTISLWIRDLSPSRLGSRAFHFSLGTDEEIYFSPHQTNSTTSVEGAHLGGTHAGVSFVDLWSASPAFTDQVWHHVAITWSSDSIVLYIDGSSVGNTVSSGVVPSDLGETSTNWLGRTLGDAFIALYAELDDLRIYDRALTATEIVQLNQLR